MIIDVDPELLIVLVETVASSIETIGSCLDEPGDCRSSALRTGERAVAALQVVTAEWVDLLDQQVAMADTAREAGEPEQHRENDDDPEMCGHNPPYFDLPGQTMCQSCGASRLIDGDQTTWAVL